MYENLKVFEERFEELEKTMMDPEILGDSNKLQKIAKEHAEIQEIVQKYRQYRSASEELEMTKMMFDEKLDDEIVVTVIATGFGTDINGLANKAGAGSDDSLSSGASGDDDDIVDILDLFKGRK